MENNLYIFVTETGAVRIKSHKDESPVIYGKKYQLLKGYVIFRHNQGIPVVSRYTDQNALIYKTELVESGKYLVALGHVQQIVKPKEKLRVLYSGIQSVASNSNFRVEEEPKLEAPYEIKLYLNFERGQLISKLLINVNPSKLTYSDIGEIIGLMKEVTDLNFKLVLKNIRSGNCSFAVIRVNRSFINTQKAYRELFQKEDAQ